MAREIFECDLPRGFLKKVSGKEKSLFLSISPTLITGKAIVYPENTRTEYTSDIYYEIKTITRYERSLYQGMDAFIIYVRVGTLYGLEKFQLIFPVMKNIDQAISMLDEFTASNKGGARPFSSLVPVTPMMVTSDQKNEKDDEQEQSAAPKQTAATEQSTAAAQSTATQSTAAEQQPAPAPTEQQQASAKFSAEELKKQFEKLEAVYQTGMISEEEYKSSKAEYISNANGLSEFYNKLKVNLQYNEIGFLSKQEFADFKKETIDECSEFSNVTNDVYKQNLKKLLMLNLLGILTDAEYDNMREEIVQAVQYASDDPEGVVVEKVERWPILKECEFLSPEQHDQFIKIVADDVKIKAADSIPELEHKLNRLTTLSGTFIFTPEEFAQKKRDFIADMSVLDYTSDTKFQGQIERLMTLHRCGWLDEIGYQEKTKEILMTIDNDSDVVKKMQLYGLLVDVKFITPDDYDKFKQGVLDKIFSQYSDISELQKRAQTLMSLNKAGVITEEEFSDFKKKLLSM